MVTRSQLQFGDFQTPPSLAAEVCRALRRRAIRPRSIVEPTCGTGQFLEQALAAFPDTQQLLGWDICQEHLDVARRRMADLACGRRLVLQTADFFAMDWQAILNPLPEPILVVGNPPWMNSARMTRLGGANRPLRSNDVGLTGLDAVTGKSNFDVAQWMLARLVEGLDGRRATLAVLCKLSTARKVLLRAWQGRVQLGAAAIRRIDCRTHFQAAVDACLLVCRFCPGRRARSCDDFASLDAKTPTSVFGDRDGRLVADLSAYDRCRALLGASPQRWRSGIKHDCARVFELRRQGRQFCNGFGQLLELEESTLFPLLKGAQLAHGLAVPERWLLVTQRAINDDTGRLRERFARTWQYLEEHAGLLDRRRSAIYRGRCRFAMFGIGPYTFAPWKIAVSGLHKQLKFTKIGRFGGKPVVLDDTCYFLPCPGEQVADRWLRLLRSPAAAEFLSAFIFWDAKRPITAETLNLLDLEKLAVHTPR
jgi:hypothetical protein